MSTNCCMELAYFRAVITVFFICTPLGHEWSCDNYGDMILEKVQTQGKNRHLLSQLCSLHRQNTESEGTER